MQCILYSASTKCLKGIQIQTMVANCMYICINLGTYNWLTAANRTETNFTHECKCCSSNFPLCPIKFSTIIFKVTTFSFVKNQERHHCDVSMQEVEHEEIMDYGQNRVIGQI